jgi:micrococcal nuclease
LKRFLILLCLFTFPMLACVTSLTTPQPGPTIDVLEAARLTMTALPGTVIAPDSNLVPTLQPGDIIPSTATPTESMAPSSTPRTGAAACVHANPIQLGMVTNVVDGNTIDVLIDGQPYRVRYIGVDAPDIQPSGQPSQYFASEAKEKNRELVENQVDMLVKDVSESDSNGLLLRYVFAGDLNGPFVNYEMIRKGYAHPGSEAPNLVCDETFRNAEVMAKAEGLGFWTLKKSVPSLTPIPTLALLTQ